MKYILMCGGNYKDKFETPKQLLKVNGEILIERTIRLLKENGIKDIAISTNNPVFDYIDTKKLKHKNNYMHNDEERHNKAEKSWLNAYYPTEEPACYIPGDIYFSEEAIKKIIETPVKDTMFFCIRDISDGRPTGINTKGREPLAYKVENQKVFRQAINELLKMVDEGKFTADPIAWNLYRQINKLPIAYNWSGSDIFNTTGNYTYIDDYTTDIDSINDILKLEKLIKIMKGEIEMIKLRVKEEFTLGRFNELRNIVRAGRSEEGRLFVGDILECDKEMADYLSGKNPLGRSFVEEEPLEVIPEEKKEPVKEFKKTTKTVTKKTTTKKATTKKKK